mmetsp:Transcript_6691/g.7696  ORF Transcript_6691/g.7696 Transcript_6691/m.7696 type:complete len:110 (+) Transcript_6691:670-999(+)
MLEIQKAISQEIRKKVDTEINVASRVMTLNGKIAQIINTAKWRKQKQEKTPKRRKKKKTISVPKSSQAIDPTTVAKLSINENTTVEGCATCLRKQDISSRTQRNFIRKK